MDYLKSDVVTTIRFREDIFKWLYSQTRPSQEKKNVEGVGIHQVLDEQLRRIMMQMK